ncbi:adhesin protein Mad1 [Colletotrichum abscissum]|uniref:Adhesin protein Mad1 n=3 Tax=Colletotrichum acutatum species complex TaxID=2707335 RepID=A0A9P9X8G9_9PEZI|nr:adhesin protein Mad1 [Colletotrichum costaricense]XP_060392358.1 adhesin protein Mad1 [Colletotrichum abscissum]KAI3543141.1 adhesin protein Mad1 [Colletotrichum filicis]KAK0375703.1 adhesin protein Mad1 [Colletotrichum limetticola]KAI3541363.1 adhesin protein Mad1 [Colletotrichum abscissum]KAK1477760.1 adhesin protein Mad1 [Colletotrichum abscissum]KAK1539928.1 adhesin protein Mad1 [Colletotrichum costaricense]
MKNSVALLALAAGVSQVTATGWNKFPSFTCPENTDNKCDDKQKDGFSWGDLNTGSFSNYGGFDFKGWTCGSDFSKRDVLAPRTFGKGKVIEGSCGSTKETSPSFGCGSGTSSPDKFSIVHFDVSVEFDCDLEFHYDMPDGSSCKHRSACSKSGTTVKNSQCGGAKNVTIVYPEQPSKPKTTCGVGIHTISFDCSPPQTTVPPKTKTSSFAIATTLSTKTHDKPVKTTSEAEATSTAVVPSVSKPTKPVEETTEATKPATTGPSKETETAPVPSKGETTSAALPSISIPADSTTAVVPSVTKPAETPIVSKPTEETTKPVESVTKPVGGETTSAALPSASVPTVPGNGTQPAETVPATVPAVPETKTTVYDTTSTVYTTRVETVTSCAPEVTNCPAKSHAVVTVTVPVSTTICPVTETFVHTPGVPSKPAATQPAGVPSQGVSSQKPVASVTVPAGPVETLPCPDVVPQCLSTWMFSSGCTDNSDVNCFCPDSKFVENVFSCIYSYGASDEIISKATQFFQGICAAHIPENPAIVTVPATITTAITVSATKPAATNPAEYTTVTVDKTIVVPCVTSGTTVPGSSTTAIIKTTLEVPHVSFATNSASVVVPVPAPSAPAGTPVAPGATASSQAPVAPYPTTPAAGASKTTPVGTGGAAVPTTTGVVVAGAGKTTFGLGAVVAIAALAAF